MRQLIIKENYERKLDLLETEVAIKFIKDNFEQRLAQRLNLTRVSAPLFIDPTTGLNDNLNGHERAVGFKVDDLNADIEIVQSLAKWKRHALKKYDFKAHEGLYTDMNAIRRDEELDSIHSLYVDQWDWELIITQVDRKLSYLKTIVNQIYQTIIEVEQLVVKKYPVLSFKLPPSIYFITSGELLELYPSLSSKERENKICQKYGAVFISQIGWPLNNGQGHDGRASDYDDWLLNGDILVWSNLLGIALELSSMGIRVDKNALINQVEHKRETDKLLNDYAKGIINHELPLTIGGGIGQSRLCMFYLEKMHIGEVQVSIWRKEDIELLAKHHIHLL